MHTNAHIPEHIYRAGLLYCHNILSTRNTNALVHTLDMAERVWHAPLQDIMRAGVLEITAQRFIEERARMDLNVIARELHGKEIQILMREDAAYPPLLTHIYDTPPALFFRGTLTPHTFAHTLAVVGSRKITPYGHHSIAHIIPALARAGITIISGMALGSDGFAHTTALDTGGTTVAFLGSGIDDMSLYPRSHISLAHRIIANGGAIISEFPPGALPLRHHFPVRNRLIAGSTEGVLVTEAAEDSGSLITARLSLEYGRDVFAIPGAIHAPLSIGPNKLIQMGAHLVLNADDILDELNLSRVQELPLSASLHDASNLSEDEQKILSALNTQPQHIDQLIENTALPPKQVATLLTMLELNGYIKHIGTHVYAAI